MKAGSSTSRDLLARPASQTGPFLGPNVGKPTDYLVFRDIESMRIAIGRVMVFVLAIPNRGNESIAISLHRGTLLSSFQVCWVSAKRENS